MQLFIEPDNDTPSPRQEMDNIGHIVSWCDEAPGDERPQCDYNTWLIEFADLIMGEEQFYRKNQAIETIESKFIFLPVYAYKHGGIVLSLAEFSCKFDSGQIGWIYLAKEDLKKHGMRDEAHAIKVLEGEIKTYNQYVSGEIIEWVLEDEDGNCIESLMGIYEYDKEEDTLDYIKSTLPEQYQHLTPERRYPS